MADFVYPVPTPPQNEAEPVKFFGAYQAVLPGHMESERKQSGGLTEAFPENPVDATDGSGLPFKGTTSGR